MLLAAFSPLHSVLAWVTKLTVDIKRIQILDPTAEDVPEELGLSPKLPDLRGKVVGLLENRKYHADSFLKELQEVLVQDYGAERVVYATKFTYSAPCAEDTIDALTAECDLVVHTLIRVPRGNSG